MNCLLDLPSELYAVQVYVPEEETVKSGWLSSVSWRCAELQLYRGGGFPPTEQLSVIFSASSSSTTSCCGSNESGGSKEMNIFINVLTKLWCYRQCCLGALTVNSNAERFWFHSGRRLRSFLSQFQCCLTAVWRSIFCLAGSDQQGGRHLDRCGRWQLRERGIVNFGLPSVPAQSEVLDWGDVLYLTQQLVLSAFHHGSGVVHQADGDAVWSFCQINNQHGHSFDLRFIDKVIWHFTILGVLSYCIEQGWASLHTVWVLWRKPRSRLAPRSSQSSCPPATGPWGHAECTMLRWPIPILTLARDGTPRSWLTPAHQTSPPPSGEKSQESSHHLMLDSERLSKESSAPQDLVL